MNVRITTGAAVAVAALVPMVPAAAAEPVHIEASEPFVEGGQATFVSNLDGCESGTGDNGRISVAGTPSFGVFNGFKHFTCADGRTFTIRLQAKFGDGGSSGTWAFVGGPYAGSGTLVGIPFPEEQGPGILDVYEGTLRP